MEKKKSQKKKKVVDDFMMHKAQRMQRVNQQQSTFVCTRFRIEMQTLDAGSSVCHLIHPQNLATG